MRRLDLDMRPAAGPARATAVILLLILGMGALAGGIALVTAPDGSAMQFSTTLLEGSPFSDYLVPGLILGGLFGVGSLVVALLAIRREALAPLLAFVIGVGQMVWIAVELAIIREFSPLHVIMFTVGLLLAIDALLWSRPQWRSPASREPRAPSGVPHGRSAS